MTGRVLHPAHGPHRPVETTPLRLPGSVRRTSTIDALRPDGLTGPLHLIGHSRDLVTGTDSLSTVVGIAALEVDIDFFNRRTVTALRSNPTDSRLQQLVEASAASGFRARAAEAVPDQLENGSLLYLLLDDVPVSALVSGHAVVSGGVQSASGRTGYTPTADLCSGWRTGGTIMLEIQKSGSAPNVTGPETPDIVNPDDPLGWHELATLPPHAMRRARRLDVVMDGSDIVLDSHFRDSHVDADGQEQTIHEYNVSVWVDPESLRVLEVAATAHVLPWVECPHATQSAEMLVGRSVSELRTFVRANMTGIDTCTHLNDQYRSLTDLTALIGLMPSGSSSDRLSSAMSQ